MRQVTINGDKVSTFNLGKVGEHNATELVITPSEYLTGNANVVSYRVYFKLRNIREIYKTDAFDTLPIRIPLTQMLTQNSSFSLQVVAFDGDGNQLLMDEKIEGFYFEPSNYNVRADDISEEMQSEIDQLRAEIGNKVTKVDGKQLSTNDYTDEDKEKLDIALRESHTHDNKETVLDKFSVSKTGSLLFDGDNIGEGSVKDWDENDPSSGKYINNRTHYSATLTEHIPSDWDGSWDSDNKPQVISNISQSVFLKPSEQWDTDAELKIYKITDGTELGTELPERKYNIKYDINLGSSDESAYWVNSSVVCDTYVEWANQFTNKMGDTLTAMGMTFEGVFEMTKDEFLVYMCELEYSSQEYPLTMDDDGNATSTISVYGMHTTIEFMPFDFEMLYITILEDNVVIPNGTEFNEDIVNITLPQLELTKGVYCVATNSTTFGVDSSSREHQYTIAQGNVSYAPNGIVKKLDIKYIPNEIKNDINNLDLRVNSLESKDVVITAKITSFSLQYLEVKLYDENGVEIFYNDIYALDGNGKSVYLIVDYTDIGLETKTKYKANIVSLSDSASPTGSNAIALMYSYLTTEYESNSNVNISYILVDSRNTSGGEYPAKVYPTAIANSYTEIKDLSNKQIYEVCYDNKPIMYNGNIAYTGNVTSSKADIYYLAFEGLYHAIKNNDGAWDVQLVQHYNANADFAITNVNNPGYIRNKPVTLAGYGIGDAYTKTETDNIVRDIYVGIDEPVNKETLWIDHDERNANSIDVGDSIVLPHTEGIDENNAWICVEKDTQNNTITLLRKESTFVADGSLDSLYQSGYNNVVVERVTNSVPEDLRQYVLNYGELKKSKLVGSNTWYNALKTGYGLSDNNAVLRKLIDDEPVSYVLLGELTYTSNKYYGDNIFFYSNASGQNVYTVRNNTEILSASGYRYKVHGVITIDGNVPRYIIDSNTNDSVILKYKTRNTWEEIPTDITVDTMLADSPNPIANSAVNSAIGDVESIMDELLDGEATPIDAGMVTYDADAEYNDGTVGKAIQNAGGGGYQFIANTPVDTGHKWIDGRTIYVQAVNSISNDWKTSWPAVKVVSGLNIQSTPIFGFGIDTYSNTDHTFPITPRLDMDGVNYAIYVTNDTGTTIHRPIVVIYYVI